MKVGGLALAIDLNMSGALHAREDDTVNRMDAWVDYKWNNFDWTIEGIYKESR